MTLTAQYAFDFPHRPSYAAAAFIAAPSNADALAWLGRTPDWPAGRLALWGEAGCGKTHLLHRWAARQGAGWVQGPALRGLPPAPDRALAIDDADAMADEEAMLHLLNAAAEAGTPVLLAGRTPPARWPITLPDLASRLRAITAVPITPPDDELLRALLASLFQERRLPVPEEVQDWMRQRLPRRAGAMREAAERLDKGQLAAHTRFTRRLAADCLAPLLIECDEISESAPQDTAPAMPLL